MISTQTQEQKSPTMEIEEEEKPSKEAQALNEVSTFQQNQELGWIINSEIFKRYTRSKEKKDACYYLYIEQLFRQVHIHELISGVKELMNPAPDTQIYFISKLIADLLTVPIEKLHDQGLNRLVAANIILGCQHHSIFSKFPITKFVIAKCDRVTGREEPKKIPLIQCVAEDKIPVNEQPSTNLSIDKLSVPMKPYVEFNLKVKKEISNYRPTLFDDMISSKFIEVDITSHKGRALSAEESKKQYKNYHNLHTIQMHVCDYLTKKKDEWIVTFYSRCKRGPQSFTHPGNIRAFHPCVIYRYVRHSDDKTIQWHWE